VVVAAAKVEYEVIQQLPSAEIRIRHLRQLSRCHISFAANCKPVDASRFPFVPSAVILPKSSPCLTWFEVLEIDFRRLPAQMIELERVCFEDSVWI